MNGHQKPLNNTAAPLLVWIVPSSSAIIFCLPATMHGYYRVQRNKKWRMGGSVWRVFVEMTSELNILHKLAVISVVVREGNCNI